MAELTGRRVLVITVSAFAVVIGVNLTLAYYAISTFPGLEVRNSYIASQTFDADRSAQLALGWTLVTGYDAGQLRLTFRDGAGLPAPVRDLAVLVGRATEARDDMSPAFRQIGGEFVAPVDLQPGKWMLQIQAVAPDGTAFRQRIDLMVRG